MYRPHFNSIVSYKLLTYLGILGIAFVLPIYLWLARQPRLVSQPVDPCAHPKARPDDAAPAQILCWERYIVSTTKTHGIDAAFQLISDLYKTNPKFTESCHGYVHKIGEQAYEDFIKGKRMDLSEKTSYCGYGFFHGFMERMVGKTKNMAGARAFCDTVGSSLAKKASSTRVSCYHGIGHGVADPHDPSLDGHPDTMAKLALAVCEEVAGEGALGGEAEACAGGFYNEMTLAHYQRLRGLALDNTDPFAFCRTQQTYRFAPICFYEFAMVLRRVTHDNIPQAFDIVSAIGSDINALQSVRALASILVSDISKFQPHEGIAQCRRLRDSLRLPCIGGLAIGFMQHGKPEIEYEQALLFCRTQELTPDERSVCFQQMISDMKAMYPEGKVHDICGRIDSEYRQSCL